MKILAVIIILSASVFCLSFSLHRKSAYQSLYSSLLSEFKEEQNQLRNSISQASLNNPAARQALLDKVRKNRLRLKSVDFWLRYLEPIAYKKINGPLPVEWETETFEKYEPP